MSDITFKFDGTGTLPKSEALGCNYQKPPGITQPPWLFGTVMAMALVIGICIGHWLCPGEDAALKAMMQKLDHHIEEEKVFRVEAIEILRKLNEALVTQTTVKTSPVQKPCPGCSVRVQQNIK